MLSYPRPPPIAPPDPLDPSLPLPRILCLHGGGTNAVIFRAQCRVLLAHLKSTFRLIFAQAPFPSEAGPDVLSVYKHFGPFRRWLDLSPDHAAFAKAPVAEIEASIEAAVAEDNGYGATGEVVGLLGFSQGAKVCASLLLRQQLRIAEGRAAGSNWRFAVLVAGRAPLVNLEPKDYVLPALNGASQSSWPNSVEDQRREEIHILRLPTIHVHGLRDPGLELHRKLLSDCCEVESTRLVEWVGDHRMPIKSKDVSALTEQIFAVAKQTGILSV